MFTGGDAFSELSNRLEPAPPIGGSEDGRDLRFLAFDIDHRPKDPADLAEEQTVLAQEQARRLDDVCMRTSSVEPVKLDKLLRGGANPWT